MSFGGFLRQSTAVDVLIGPFVSATDGDSEMTGLTIAQADVRLSKNGQAGAQKNDNTTAAHDADGMYNCELDATDTNTVGQLVLWVHVATALLVRHEWQVIEEAVYDGLFEAAATGLLPANVTQWNGSAVATPTIAGVPEVDITHLVGVAQSATDLKDFADDGYDPATNKVQGVVLTDTTTTLTGVSVATIADGVWDEDATGHQTQGTFGQAIGDPGADTTTIWGEVNTNLDTTVSSRSSQATQDIIHTNVTQIETAADAIKVQTDKLVFTVANKLDANITAVDGNTAVPTQFRRSLLNMHDGSVTGAATTTTLIDSTLTQPHTDALKGRIVIFEGNTTAALADQATDITGFDPTTDQLTFTALTTAPASGDRYIIV